LVVFNTESEDFDGVATSNTAGDVVVNT